MLKKLRRIYNVILFKLSGIEYNKETLKTIRALRNTQRSLQRYGGKKHVTGRGCLRTTFGTTSGERAYYANLRKQFYERK